jgi:hypothetical protein
MDDECSQNVHVVRSVASDLQKALYKSFVQLVRRALRPFLERLGADAFKIIAIEVRA